MSSSGYNIQFKIIAKHCYVPNRLNALGMHPEDVKNVLDTLAEGSVLILKTFPDRCPIWLLFEPSTSASKAINQILNHP